MMRHSDWLWQFWGLPMCMREALQSALALRNESEVRRYKVYIIKIVYRVSNTGLFSCVPKVGILEEGEGEKHMAVSRSAVLEYAQKHVKHREACHVTAGPWT